MNSEDVIKYSKRNNRIHNSVDRTDFVCLEINIQRESRWLKRVCSLEHALLRALHTMDESM